MQHCNHVHSDSLLIYTYLISMFEYNLGHNDYGKIVSMALAICRWA